MAAGYNEFDICDVMNAGGQAQCVTSVDDVRSHLRVFKAVSTCYKIITNCRKLRSHGKSHIKQ